MINETINIHKEIEKILAEQIDAAIKNLDIGSILVERLDCYIRERVQNSKFNDSLIDHSQINWNGFFLSMNKLGPGTVRSFNSSGIQDVANDINLTVADGQVIVEGETVSNCLTVLGESSMKDLEVNGDLTVKGKVNFTNPMFTQQLTGLVENQINDYIKNHNNELSGKPLLSNGNTLIDHNSLGNTVAESNLRSVGRLRDLTVSGMSSLAETAYIGNQKLGINTDEPDGALTIWDQESELTIKKFKNRNMYLGSTRGSSVTIGTDNNNSLTVTKDGIETNCIKLGNITVGTSASVPTHSASPGDIMFNEKASKGEPWCWRCNGNKNWVAIYQ